MPRSASSPFNYSVPSGTAAVPGAVISSTAYNNFLADLTNNAMNAAWPIAYGGTGTTDGSALVPDGSAASPAVRFQSETNSGWYRGATGDVDLSILGTKRVSVTATGLAVTGTITATGTSIAQTSLSNEAFINLSLSASVGASALTIAIKGVDGNDPSVTNPVTINFRSATAASGAPAQLTLTAATSLVISSGSTMGFTSAVAGRLWIVGFNDAGTFRLAAINCRSGTSIFALSGPGIASSTAEGGAGAADSAFVFYTGTAVTSKAYTILGYMDLTEATAGTWATGPSTIKVFALGDKKPGDLVQSQRLDTGAVATGTTTVPADDTIPQNTEGTQFMNVQTMFTALANVCEVTVLASISSTLTANAFIGFIVIDAVANALVATEVDTAAVGQQAVMPLNYRAVVPAVSGNDFKFRAGNFSASTITFNGNGGGRRYGGVINSYMEVKEWMA